MLHFRFFAANYNEKLELRFDILLGKTSPPWVVHWWPIWLRLHFKVCEVTKYIVAWVTWKKIWSRSSLPQASYQGPTVHARSAAWGGRFQATELQSNAFRFPLGFWKKSIWCSLCCKSHSQKTMALWQHDVFLGSRRLVCGLVCLLLITGLSFGNGFHKIGWVGVAAKGQKNWCNSEQHIQHQNRPPFVCWDSVREGSAGVEGASNVAPLGLGRTGEKVTQGPHSTFYETKIAVRTKTWATAPARKMVQSNIQLHPGIVRP